MSPSDIEAQLRADTSWQRPSWPLGSLGQTARMDTVLQDRVYTFAFGSKPVNQPTPAIPPELKEALQVFGLIWPVTLTAVKAKYKELAKRHHPDANGGNKGSEEMLKTINLAYATLRGKLSARQANPAQQAAD